MPNAFADLIKEHTGKVTNPTLVSTVSSNDAQLVQEMEKDIKKTLKQISYEYTPDSIHASQVYKECPRKWWLLKQKGMKHESMSIGCGLAVCFEIGHSLHKMVQDRYIAWLDTRRHTLMGNWRCEKCLTPVSTGVNFFSAFPKDMCCSTRLYDFVEPYMSMKLGNLPLVGKCDGVIAVDQDPWAVLEIKTANEWSYNQDPEDWDWWPGYVWQAHAYMRGFGLDKTVFMILNKAKQSGSKLPIKFKLVEFDEDIWEEVRSRALLLNEIQRGDWDGYKMTDLSKTCKAGSIDKNCPVAIDCAKGIV